MVEYGRESLLRDCGFYVYFLFNRLKSCKFLDFLGVGSAGLLGWRVVRIDGHISLLS